MATKCGETRLVKALLGNRTVEGGDGDGSKVQRMKPTRAQISIVVPDPRREGTGSPRGDRAKYFTRSFSSPCRCPCRL